MKKITAFLLIAFALVFSACAPVGAAGAAVPSVTPGIVAENYPNALPVPSQLALGIINLKDKPNAVNSKEGAALLPLWKGLLALAETATSSTVEINALIGQIQDSMTPEQLQAIAAMKLTQADFAKVGFGGGGGNGAIRTPGAGRTGATGGAGGNRTGGNGGGGNFGGPGGGGFGGGIPGAAGGNTAAGQGTVSNATQATVTARQSRQSLTGNPFVITAVINFLNPVAGQ